MADEVKENFKYKYPGYLSNQETITSAKLNSIISAINTLTDNLMNHDHLGKENANGETTRGPKLIGFESIEENSITNKCLVDRTIESNKIADNAITTTKIALENITTALIQNEAITSEKLRNNAITRDKIVNGLITSEKIHESVFEDIFDMIYPIGSVYITLAEQETCPLEEIRGSWYPIAKGKVLQGANNLAELGNEISAGLPNITGSFMSYDRANGWYDSSGQFYVSSRWNGKVKSGDNDNWGTIVTLDASRSNTIYGRSNTVQPPALLVNIFKRIEDHTKIIRIICNTPGATITITVNNQSQTFQNGEAYKEVHLNDTYSYEITKNNYIREYKSGIITDNIYYETTLQLQSLNMTIYNSSENIYNIYTIPIKKTGIYQIELAGGKSTRGGDAGYTGNGGKAVINNISLSNGDEIKFYTIKAGSTSYATGGVGVGVKLNNQWLCVVGGAGALVNYGSIWAVNFDAVGGGGYIGGNAINATRNSSPGYSAYNNGEIGNGTGDTNGSGYSITSDFGKGYGGTGYINPNYSSYATLTTNSNGGDAYIKYSYIGQ